MFFGIVRSKSSSICKEIEKMILREALEYNRKEKSAIIITLWV